LGLEGSGTGYAQHFLRGNERRDCYSRHSQEKPQHMISSDSEDGARAAISKCNLKKGPREERRAPGREQAKKIWLAAA
jgi:hypothetical protein